MSVTIADEIYFQKIISIDESKLQKNFSIIFNRLNKLDKLYAQQNDNMNNMYEQTKQHLQTIDKVTQQQKKQLDQHISQTTPILQNIKQSIKSQKKQLQMHMELLNILQKKNNLNENQLEQQANILKNTIEEVNGRVQQIDQKTNALSKELSYKQTISEVQKISKQIKILQQKSLHFDSVTKITQNKIDKLQIFNEKSQRLQAKRDIDFIKDIQDKVKKEVKTSFKTILQTPNSNTLLNPNSIHLSNSNTNSYRDSQSMTPQSVPTQSEFQMHRASIKNDQSALNAASLARLVTNMEPTKPTLSKYQVSTDTLKLGEKVSNLQSTIKKIQQGIKGIKENKKESPSSDIIKERINEIKPQLIKLWAKFDTLEDRMQFNERKLDERSKVINELVALQKDNNWGKLQDKFKVMQAEIFALLKDINTKIQGKVNSTDYQKYRITTEDKLAHHLQLIYLKSDKLEVKKALLFLESKIKEIILVISQDEENQREALLTKKQLKCMSCDKDVDKFTGYTSGIKGNWDALPFKDHPPELLGRFGMTSFGSMAKKLRKLQSKELPALKKKPNTPSGNEENNNSST